MSPTRPKAMSLQVICRGHTQGKPYPTQPSCQDWKDTQQMVRPRLSPTQCSSRTCHDITHTSVIVSVHLTPPQAPNGHIVVLPLVRPCPLVGEESKFSLKIVYARRTSSAFF